MYNYNYPRPSISVDIVLFRKIEDDLQVLLIQRAQEPYQDSYALPGGFVDIEETLEDAAARELFEETGLDVGQLTQIHTFSDPDRDPRGRVISTAYCSMLLEGTQQEPRAGSDASDVSWFSLSDLPELAFDHAKIIQLTVSKMDLPL